MKVLHFSNKLGYVVALGSIATFLIICELVFVRTFTSILAGNFENIALHELLLSMVAPISSIIFFTSAYLLGIKIANMSLQQLEIEYNSEDNSPLKLLVEDYNMAFVSVIVPLLMLTYRALIVAALSSSAFITYYHFVDIFATSLFVCLLIIIFFVFKFVKKKAIKFSAEQNIRMNIVTEIINSRQVKLDGMSYTSLMESNTRLLQNKIFIGIFAFAAKPIADFAVILIVVITLLFFKYDNVTVSSLLGLAVIGYRLAGPCINIASNVNQINFGWASLSTNWKVILLDMIKSK